MTWFLDSRQKWITYLDVPKFIFLKKGHDELFEGLKAQILQKNKQNSLVSNLTFPNCGLYSLFSVHGCASGLKSTDAGDTELY